MATGRPTTYRKSYCKAIIDYFRTAESKGFFPTVPGFATTIGTFKQRLYAWCDDHEEFRDSFKEALSYAEAQLLTGAMSRKYDAGFSRFLASNYHDLHEKAQLDTTVNVTGLNIRFVDSTATSTPQ